MKRLVLVLLLAVGCIPIRPRPASELRRYSYSPAQIAHCRSLQHSRDGWGLAGSLLGVLGGGLGGVAGLVTDDGQRLGWGLGGAAAGLLSAVAAEVSTLVTGEFSSDGCSQVLAP